MPAPTVVSSSASVVGPVRPDGSYWCRQTLTTSDGRTLLFDNLDVPAGSDNNALLAQRVAEVNAELAVVPSPVPSWAARSAINTAGLKASVEAAVSNAAPSVQTLWYTSAYIDRTDPDLLALAAAIGLTSDQVDDLFRQANAL